MSARKVAVVVMGVAGSGKTTIGKRLAEMLGWGFVEGDSLHPAANVAKMSAGTPLTDEDRWPWLREVASAIDAAPGNVVVTCSSLRRAYRDVLREADADVRFLHLHGETELLSQRIGGRRDHFMPPELLLSQLELLEPLAGDESGVVVDVALPPTQIVTEALAGLGLTA